MDKPIRIRKKRRYKCPNPLFEQWITEWRDSAKSKGLKSHYNFAKALSSLRKYPLPLSSGREAKMLEHFGNKICSMLDERLLAHRSGLTLSNSQESSSSSTSIPLQSRARPTFAGKVSTAFNKTARGANSESQLVSTFSTELPCSQESSSSSSVSLQPFRRTVPKPHFTENFSSAIHPDERIGLKPSVFLSSRLPVLVDTDNFLSCEPLQEDEESFILQPGHFDILLCVDNCETFSGQGKSKKMFLDELKKCGVEFHVRKLNVGDFLWIAKERESSEISTNKPRELVLDFVVERKRLDDLSHSIKDGRFREQKFRLRNCGVRRPIYLVESHRSQSCTGIPLSTLEQAIINTQIVDGFTVQRTKDTKESVAYLSNMTRYIQSTFQNRTLKSGSRHFVQNSSSPNVFLTFEGFHRGATKNKCLSIREMFAKHLLQFHGLSVDRAAAIVDRFETPAKFLKYLQSCSSETERIKMLAELKYGKFQRTLGQALGKTIQSYYTSPHQQ